MDLTHIRFEGTPVTPGRRVPIRALNASRSRSTDDPAPVSGLPAVVLERAGLEPSFYRQAPLKRRTPACLRALRVESDASAIERLAIRPDLARVALNTLLIGVSEFFRDSLVFRALETTIMPTLQQRRSVRVLSVGCSSGAELYSVAMMLAESGILDRAYLLGVDCRPDAVAAARDGLFTETDLASVDAALRSRYLEPAIGRGRVVTAIRRHTNWRVLDATRECPAGPWDLLLCRNVSIYLQNSIADAMIGRMVEQLMPGGFLVVGKAERPPSRLQLTEVGRSVYQTNGA